MYTEGDNLQTITALNEPPPSYDCVIALDEVISRKRKNLYTFKGCQHHPGHERKDCFMNGNGTATPTSTTPQVSLDEHSCDIQNPSSAESFCNCNCEINQNYSNNLCANCNNVIDNMNNNITCPLTTISGSNLVRDNCPLLSDTNRSSPPKTETDLSNDQLNNNNYNGNSNLFESAASPSTSTSANYNSCPLSLSGERQKCSNETEDEDETDGNGNCRLPGTVNLSTINRNGLIRLDMSQIIDQTGLPTYEAALHLKSSGYV